MAKHPDPPAPWIRAVTTRPVQGLPAGSLVYVRRARTEAGWRVLGATVQFVVTPAHIGRFVVALRTPAGVVRTVGPSGSEKLNKHLATIFKSTLPVACSPKAAKSA